MAHTAYAVIMAGGRGERFWPLSTSRRPKQFLSLIGGKPLIAAAVDRLTGLIPPEAVLIITNADLVEATRAAVPAVPPANVIGEPFGRDTAAAVALGMTLVKAASPSASFCVLTADQVMGDEDLFRETLRESLGVAGSGDWLVTIGIKPTQPSTGFGYIEVAAPLRSAARIEFFSARRFVEKPDAATARQYMDSGRYFWNSGMFVWSVASLERALLLHCPALHAMSARLLASVGQPGFAEVLRSEYERIDRISVDYALMEKATNIVMAKGVFPWDDVGSWPAIENHFPADATGSVVVGSCESVDSGGNIVVSEGRVTALLGVRDLIVIHADGVTLVCPKSRAQEIKKLVQHLKSAGHYDHLL